jgi:dihydrofolate synthase / folylpolyglutamate synthase
LTSAAAQALLSRLQTRGIKLGLDKVRDLLARIGLPDARFVQVAGTNGKGSVAHGLEAIALGQGVSTGTFTSPHLISPTERVRIGGAPLDPDEFGRRALDLGDRLEAWSRENPALADVTYFEFMLGLALDTFADRGVELIVLEVGLGGRLDATTAAPAQLSCITSIALDHEAWLGFDVASIAAEKAGILRPATPLVLGPVPPLARATILEAAAAVAAPVIQIEQQQGVRNGMWGEHQQVNAALSLALAGELGLDTGPAALAALAQSRVPGRCEAIARSPEILVDGCHNPAGAAALATVLGRHTCDGKTFLVTSVGEDKDARGILEPLVGCADEILVTRYAEGRGATAVDDLADVVRALGREPQCFERAPAALAAALGRAGPRDRILVAGSLFLAGELRAHVLPGVPA